MSAGELLREARAAFVVMLRAENVLSDISKWSVKQHWSGPENGFSDDATQRRWLDFNKGWIAARAHLSQASERADWVMVPREPTEAMYRAFYDTVYSGDVFRELEKKFAEGYAAMLSAAPAASVSADARDGVKLPDSIQELQALRASIDMKLHYLVCGDPRIGVGFAMKDNSK